MNAPVGLQGSWIFVIIHGRPLPEHLRSVLVWVSVCACAVTTLSFAVLHIFVSSAPRGALPIATQIVIAIGLPIVLAKAFLLRIREIPFTATRTPATTDLPVSFVRYAVIFPALVLFVIDHEPWIEADIVHLLMTMLWFVATFVFLSYLRRLYLEKRNVDSDDEVLVHRLGLQE